MSDIDKDITDLLLNPDKPWPKTEMPDKEAKDYFKWGAEVNADILATVYQMLVQAGYVDPPGGGDPPIIRPPE